MAQIGVSITKSTLFRGVQQEFSNVYHYIMPSLPNETEAAAIIDNLVALEKTFHSTAVTFVRGRLWSAGGTKAENNMINQHNLSGTGARATNTTLDKERAFLFRIRAGSDSRGNPVYLRKWFHACGEFVSAQTVPNNLLDNTAGWTTTQRNAQVAAMAGIENGNGSSGGLQLCAKSGRLRTLGESFSAHQYLEHHQLGDQWRAQ